MKYFYYLNLLLMFSSCVGQEQESAIIGVDYDSYQTLELSSLVKAIKLIPLETSDSCLIQKINQLIIQNNKIYVNNNTKEVLVFNNEGDFIMSTAKRLGEGPEDYFRIASMDITEEGFISLYDGFQIKEYDARLNLINKYSPQIPDYIRSAQELPRHIKFGKETYLIREHEHTCVYSTKCDSILKLEHEYFHPYSHIGNVNSLRILENGENIYFSPSYICDTLYLFDKKNYDMLPIVIYDTKDSGVNLNRLPSDMNIEYYMNYLLNTDKIFLTDKIQYKKNDLAFGYCIKNDEAYVVHRNNKGYVTIYKGNEKRLPVPHAVFENTMVYAAMPDELNTYIDIALLDSISLKYVNTLLEDDNQVLVYYELKE